MDEELTPEQAAPLIGAAPAMLRALIDAGTGWRYFRTETGLETRHRDGTIASFQELTPSGERVGPQRVYVHERED